MQTRDPRQTEVEDREKDRRGRQGQPPSLPRRPKPYFATAQVAGQAKSATTIADGTVLLLAPATSVADRSGLHASTRPMAVPQSAGYPRREPPSSPMTSGGGRGAVGGGQRAEEHTMATIADTHAYA